MNFETSIIDVKTLHPIFGYSFQILAEEIHTYQSLRIYC